MCGIAGIFTSSGNTEAHLGTVAAMTERLARRGPDGRGLLQERHAVLGHRRLKIIDLSESGQQPMISHCERYVIAYNGECYNYQELAAELGLSAGNLRSGTDTEIVLEAWAAWGPASLDRFVGQFAFAVYDRLEHRLWLARDRFGEKPIFYHASPGVLAFASSISSLFACPLVPRELDPDAVREYVTLRYVVAPHTVVKDVLKVPPGALLRVDIGGTALHQWYDPHYGPLSGSTPGRVDREMLADTFGTLFRQATLRCATADVKTGLLLSDGIDSNAIHAVLQESGRGMPTFTYGYYNSERRLTLPRSTGARTGVNAGFEFSFSATERLAAMRTAFANFTEPVGDGAALATWLLLSRARSSATVFLCGHGADEVLGGYRLSQDRFRLRALRYLAFLPRAVGGVALDRHLYGSEPLAERMMALRRSAREKTPEVARYLIHRPLPVRDLNELLSRDSGAAQTGYLQTVSALYGRCLPGAPDVDRIQKVLLHTFLSENILSFSDSVAMDSSVELRMPFLDRDLVQFALQLPVEARVGVWPASGQTKRILRWWGATHLDQAMVAKRKRSFDFGSLRPILANGRGELQSYILGSDAVRRQLQGVECWLSHPPDYYRGCWQGTLWALLALGVWCQANGVRA